jgi:tight adherence protein B
VPAAARFVKDTTAPLVRKTMLTIDVSGSMKDPISAGSSTSRIQAAQTAAQSYLAKVPSDVLVGLVTFESQPRVVVAPTTRHDVVLAAVRNLRASNGNTALYAGVIAANTALGAEDATTQLNQLIISDGRNDDPTGPSEASAIASIKKSRVQVDAVTIAPEPIGTRQLRALTAAGAGSTVDATSSADLTAAFESAAATQRNQLLVTIPVPPEFVGTTQTVEVSVDGGGGTFRDASAFALPGVVTAVPSAIAAVYGPQPVDTTSGGLASQGWVLPVAIAAFAIGFFGLLAGAFLASDRENQTSGRIRRRLSRYSLTSRTEPQAVAVATSGALGQSQVARSAVELAGRVVQRRDLDTGLGAKLEAAGIPLKPAEWMIIHLGIAIVGGLALALLTGFGMFATLLGLVLGLVIPFLYLSVKEGRRKAEFARALPETLQLLAGSLAAGYSLPQAVDTVVRESSGPMALELNRAIVEARLGVPIEDALETVARRMDSVDFEWVVMAIRIQRDVGGNLAEVLTTVAATMRERERLRRQVDVLSAEGKLSAIILGALPLLFVSYLVLVRPEYIGVLVTDPMGIVLVVVGVLLLVAGGFWLRKIVTVEV